MKLEKNEKMPSSLLDGVEFDDFRYQGGSQFAAMKKTGFPYQPEGVAEILSSHWEE